jgi:molybdopterin synthase sulfur carrier subunit
MKVTVKFAGTPDCMTDLSKKIDYVLNSQSSLDNLIDLVDKQFPGFKGAVCKGQAEVADHINIFVNGDNVRYLRGLDTELKEGDAIHIIPAAAGG